MTPSACFDLSEAQPRADSAHQTLLPSSSAAPLVTGSTPTPLSFEVRRSSRISRPPDRLTYEDFPLPIVCAFLSSVHSIVEPKSDSEAASQSCWKEAMQEELKAIIKNQRFGTLSFFSH